MSDRIEFVCPPLDETVRHWIDSAPTSKPCEEALRALATRCMPDLPVNYLAEVGEILLRYWKEEEDDV